MNYLRLLWLIVSQGRLKHSGEDFSRNRIQQVKELKEFIPDRSVVTHNNISPQKGITRNIIAQLSFIKSSFRLSRGHIGINDFNYIRIPKAASTSICKEILEKIYPALKQKVVTETQINFLTDFNLGTDVPNSQTFFTIVRNPFARLVSVYRDFFENPAHYIYRDYLFGILPQHLTFSEFVDRVNSIPDRLKDQHLKPQHTFFNFYLEKGAEVRVFKLEEPELLIKFLNQYDLNLPHMNKSGSYDYRSYYDQDTLQKALEIYRVDVTRFGYEKEYKMLSEFTLKGR